MVKYSDLGVADPLAKALDVAGYKTVGWIVSLGAIVSMSAVLLVFQYGQPRIFFAMARDGLLPPWAAKSPRTAACPISPRSSPARSSRFWALIGDANETYNLTNIGTLFAFALVSAGVFVLRFTEPDRPRPFRVPWFWVTTIVSVGLCIYVMLGFAARDLDPLRGLARDWTGPVSRPTGSSTARSGRSSNRFPSSLAARRSAPAGAST